MTVFTTLGPEGTNHVYVTRKYLQFHGLAEAGLVHADSFDVALRMMTGGEADFLVQAAAHADTASTLSKAHFRHGIHVIDTFIAPSQPLGILTRTGIARPRSIGLQTATASYADLGRWRDQVAYPTTVAAGQAMLEGITDSALTQISLAEKHPDHCHIDQVIGTVDDAWLVFGRQRVCRGEILAWADSPARALYR